MALSSPNEPTEGPGGMRVYDSEGFFVGNVRRDYEKFAGGEENPEAPSEDLARVVIDLSHEAKDKWGLRVEQMDVEATWLEAPDVGDHLVLDRPLQKALVEQGFDL